jgi:hypothetical protein
MTIRNTYGGLISGLPPSRKYFLLKIKILTWWWKSSSFNCDIHDVVEMDTLQVKRDLKIKEILNETTKSKEVFRNCYSYYSYG